MTTTIANHPCEVLSYGLGYHFEHKAWAMIVPTEFNRATGAPTMWAVRIGKSIMNSRTGKFDKEPRPSKMTHRFSTSHRFGSPESAAKSYFYFNPKKP